MLGPLKGSEYLLVELYSRFQTVERRVKHASRRHVSIAAREHAESDLPTRARWESGKRGDYIRSPLTQTAGGMPPHRLRPSGRTCRSRPDPQTTGRLQKRTPTRN